MTDENLKSRIEAFISENRHVTSARLAKSFGRDLSGSITCAENLVIAPGLSAEEGCALMDLVAEGRVFWSPISRTAYDLDGLFLDLPITYAQKPCKTPHWLPAAFNTPEVHERLVDAMSEMGRAVGWLPGKIDLEWVGWLQAQQDAFTCRTCGKCCKISSPISLEPQDVERLSDHLGLSIKDALRKYAVFVEKDGQQTWAMKKDKPCQFYNKKTHLCKIHAARPMICRTFPFLSPRTVNGLGEGELGWCPAVSELVRRLSEGE